MFGTHRAAPTVGGLWLGVGVVTGLVFVLLVGLVSTDMIGVATARAKQGTAPYQLVENWPEMPPDDPRFGTMSGVAAANGVVYGLNRDRGTVWMWESKSGRYLGDWGPGVTVFSHDMEYDRHEGVIWVADRDAHLVKKYSLDGELLMTLGHYEEPGWDDGHFNGPADIAVAANGDIFVADGYWNQRVVKFSKNGQYVGEVGTRGRGKWQFGLLHHIEVTAGGRLFISDLCGYGTDVTPGRFPCPGARTVVLDTDLNWLDEWSRLAPTFVRGDTLYVWSTGLAESGAESNPTGREAVVLRDARTGSELDRIPIQNPTSAHQIVMDEDEDIFTSDEALVTWSTTAQRLGGHGAIRRYTRDSTP